MPLIVVVQVAFISGPVVTRRGGLLSVIPAVVMISAALFLYVRAIWQGGVEVRWKVQTLLLGRTATFYVGTTPRGSRLLDAEVHLRCVGPSGDRTRRQPDSSSRALWTATVALSDERAPGPDEFTEVTFELPPDAPASALDARPPVYWELIVRGRTLWGTVTESFLLPVHAARRAPSAVAPAS